MVDIDEYLKMRQRPQRRAAMYQKWRDLTFLHVAIDPAAMQRHLPKGLTIDTFADQSGRQMAWLGLVPFWMKGIRPRRLPPMPGLSSFPETNVRTYVHRDGMEPGVWFFTLDAANAVACAWARRFYSLNYLCARMFVDKNGSDIKYSSTRVEEPAGFCSAHVKVGIPLKLPTPGSLEFFLIERYMLYAEKKGSLFTGRVFHKPYSVQEAQLQSCSEDLTRAFPYRPNEAHDKIRHWDHVMYSPGADVEVFKIQPVKR